jgi:CHRD domain
MVRKRGLHVAAAAVIAGLAAGSYALAGALDGPGKVPDTKAFHARLNGFQETPSNSTTGFGDFDARLVGDNTLHYVFRYAGLEGGNSLFAHVHFAQRGVAGGIMFFLCGGGGKPACPNVEGTVEGNVTPADVIGPNGQGIEPGSFAEMLRAMRAGHSYANIHTTRWPAGEIRGQINDKDQKEFDK